MPSIVMDNLDACTDCAIWHTNADDSGSERTGAELTAAYLSTWDGWADATTGRLPHVIITDASDSRFLTSPCDICGEGLAGDRLPAVLMD